MQAIFLLVSHILSTDLRECTVENQVISKRIDYPAHGADFAYPSVKLFSYRRLRQKLYPFLRMAFENWPRDESLEMVVDLWLAYITPWTVFGESFSEAWYV